MGQSPARDVAYLNALQPSPSTLPCLRNPLLYKMSTEDIEQKIKYVESEIEVTYKKIEEILQKIEDTESKLNESREKDDLRKTLDFQRTVFEQLRTEKEQLRSEKAQLRTEKEQLRKREEQLITEQLREKERLGERSPKRQRLDSFDFDCNFLGNCAAFEAEQGHINTLEPSHPDSYIPVELSPTNPPPFRSFLTSPLFIQWKSSQIIVTEEMKQLHDLVVVQNQQRICLFGGPGCGKTTTLVWLYCQLLRSESKLVPVVGNFSDTFTCSKELTKKSVLLMDLSNPPIESKSILSGIIGKFIKCHAVVLAVSSSFKARLKQTVVCTAFNRVFSGSKVINCVPFTNIMAEQFISCLRKDVKTEEMADLLDMTKRVPRLLSCVSSVDFKETIEKEIAAEFEDSMNCIPIGITTVVEVKILLACKFSVPLSSVLVSQEQAEDSILLLANLVRIENGLPCCYFKLSTKLIDIVTKCLWIPYTMANVSTASGFGDVFQGAVFHQFCPKMEIQARKFKSENDADIQKYSIRFANAAPIVYNKKDTIEKSILYSTEERFKGIDFLSLQDQPVANTLIGIQVTMQGDQQKAKLDNTIQNFPSHLREHEGVLLIMVNPNWVSRDGFSIAFTCSKVERTMKSYPKEFYYGELCEFDGLNALVDELKHIHRYRF